MEPTKLEELLNKSIAEYYKKITLTIKPKFILINEYDFKRFYFIHSENLKFNFNEKELRREYTYKEIPLVRTADITEGTIQIIS